LCDISRDFDFFFGGFLASFGGKTMGLLCCFSFSFLLFESFSATTRVMDIFTGTTLLGQGESATGVVLVTTFLWNRAFLLRLTVNFRIGRNGMCVSTYFALPLDFVMCDIVTGSECL
jgi:hypothetical protein